MKALDTNVLIRFLVRDDKQQADLAYNKLKQAEANQEVLFFSNIGYTRANLGA